MPKNDGRPDWEGIKQGLTPPSKATVSRVASSIASVLLLAANPDRKGFKIFNDSTAILYFKYGEDAASNDFTVKLTAGSYFENALPVYTGAIEGVWAAENGAAQVTELS
jgi:hypothetical protein